jgi:hypothetical protein
MSSRRKEKSSKVVSPVISSLMPPAAREVWKRAYEKALKDYGSKAQAERIAWGAIDHVRMAQGRARRRAA